MNVKYHTLIGLCISLALFGSVVFFYLFEIQKDTAVQGSSIVTNLSSVVAEGSVLQDTTNTIPLATDTYHDPSGVFSFTYPQNFSLRETMDELRNRLLVLEDSATGKGLQIRIQNAFEGVAITPARIAHDLPDILIDDQHSILVGKSGSGISFFSDNQAFDGASREVWFSYKTFVYQVSTYKAQSDLVDTILSTWHFK